jgi:hypothetical protein
MNTLPSNAGILMWQMLELVVERNGFSQPIRSSERSLVMNAPDPVLNLPHRPLCLCLGYAAKKINIA